MEERSSLPLGLPGPLPSFFALAFTFVSRFTFAFTFAFGNVRVGRIVVSNIHVIHREGWGRGWVNSDPWRTKRSGARGTYREIYPTKISWNLENQNSTRNPQVK